MARGFNYEAPRAISRVPAGEKKRGVIMPDTIVSASALVGAKEVNAMRRRTPLVAMICVVVALVIPGAAAAEPPRTPNGAGLDHARTELPKPRVEQHADEAPPTAGGDGTGTNAMVFSGYENGDMVIALGSATGHAGEWDSAYYRGSLYDRCLWSANTAPVNGVQLEAPVKYRSYDYAYGIWVPSLSALKRAAARTYCRYQKGEPYNIGSSKTNQSAWYCSKLLWSSYRYTSSIDLDADGGYWVWPVDLLNDSQTSVFAFAK